MAKLLHLIGTSKKFAYFLFFLATAVSVSAQTVKGIVLDNRTNEPVIGASVLIKGGAANTGAVTDFSGEFTLKITELPAVIEVSFVGYKTQEIDIYEVSGLLTVALAEDL
ncbi:MAG: carboxypeptidase-like regulatory domain-containing protein, partial [Tannerella sp.]|nr:carboxypeptidase-like regulatory domain-containing protein [Tannerella sp.]